MVKTRSDSDVPMPVALAALAMVLAAYFYLVYFRFVPWKLSLLSDWGADHVSLLYGSAAGLTVNFVFLGMFFRRTLGFGRQGSKLEALQGERRFTAPGRCEVLAALVAAGLFLTLRVLVLPVPLLSPLWADRIRMAGSGNFALALFFLTRLVLRLASGARFSLFKSLELELPEVASGEIVLGTTSGELSREAAPKEEKWVKIPARGVAGGIFIAGSVGSGKTQGTVLRYLSQLLAQGEQCPAILAIDPKRTYLEEAEKMICDAGLGHRIVKISLKGNVSFNPVYMKHALRDSNFASVSEMVRAAAVNFMGKASDSPFWDISSAVLIRNAIAYCAAKFGYFTLLDLYQTIVLASKQSLAGDLKTCLAKTHWTEEERFNIERAMVYFESEFSQLEDRVRTGIVATSTAFINQFQEFAASRVFCPKEERLAIRSMEGVIRDGKILLFDVNQPGLARSMGTFVKLHFEQAVLNLLGELKQVSKPHSVALVIDEYQDVVTCGGGGTIGDDNFMAKAREAKPAVIAATQSVSSLMEAVGRERPAMVLLQNFRTRIACHSSDLETIRLFRELAGKEDVVSKTHSLSETSPAARFNVLAGGFDSENSGLNESVSQSTRQEDLITGKEFSRLRTFEAFAQVFDGIETRFFKLYLKPHFLRFINTKHEVVLDILRGSKEVGFVEPLKRFGKASRGAAASLLLAGSVQAAMIPNACTVAASPAFSSCLDLSVLPCVCGVPPHPCTMISYYVPATFIEVWPEQRASYFTGIPGATAQLSRVTPLPFGAEGDDDTQSFEARAIAVPLASLVFRLMPAEAPRSEKLRFDVMSEDFGTHWRTGKGDSLQPAFLAWGAAPKACLLVGAATSLTGTPSGSVSPDSLVCSFPQPVTSVLPPSAHPVCNGWGVFYPRYGTYAGPASMAGALMVASRIKSLGAEVLHSMPSSLDEKWQMVLPQVSSCFREGENVGLVETVRNARETMRLVKGRLKGYLFVVWQKVSTCKEATSAAQAQAAALAIPAACRGFE